MKPKNTAVTMIPNLRYLDCNKAIYWLCDAFGFEQRQIFRNDAGDVIHAELTFGNGMIMIGPVAESPFARYLIQPDEALGKETQCCYCIVDDVDAHHKHAVASGAEVFSPPTDKNYGGRDYGCHDFEGHLWSFGTYDPWEK